MEPKWLQWLPSKMGPDVTLYSCVVFFDSEELRNAALQSLLHSFYGWRVTSKEQRPPPKPAGPKMLAKQAADGGCQAKQPAGSVVTHAKMCTSPASSVCD